MCLRYFSHHCKHHIMELQELQRKWLLRAKLKTFIVTQTRFYQLAQAESLVIHLPQTCLQREAKRSCFPSTLSSRESNFLVKPSSCQNIPWTSYSAKQCQDLQLTARTDFNKHSFLLFKGAYLNSSSSKCAGYF